MPQLLLPKSGETFSDLIVLDLFHPVDHSHFLETRTSLGSQIPSFSPLLGLLSKADIWTCHTSASKSSMSCPSVDEWINKMWSLHAMEYYSVWKRKDIVTHATTWMNLEDVMLSDISQIQKDSIVWLHLYEASIIVKFIKIESRIVITRNCQSR